MNSGLFNIVKREKHMILHRSNIVALAFAGVAANSGLAVAEEDVPVPISANITFTTDYVWRGVSLSNENFAVQGGFDWESESTGIYLGTWGSNVSLAQADVEIDFYGGWAKNWGDWGTDIGVIHYDYPGESRLNTDEVYVTGSWKWLSASYYSIVSSEYFGTADARGSAYITVAAAYTFPIGLTLGGSYGTTQLSGTDAGVANSTLDYDDYKISLGYSYTGLDFELAWTDNDSKSTNPIFEDRVFFSVSKSF